MHGISSNSCLVFRFSGVSNFRIRTTQCGSRRNMKVLLLNTYSSGGAAVACKRLGNAIQKTSNVEVNLLDAEQVGNRWPFYAERLSFLPYERDKSVRFSFARAKCGKNIRQHPLVKEADVLHLHWVNQGFLSIEGIHALAELDKPIVWTLHDMWTFTGGCHYSRGCDRFQNSCGNCPFLKHPSPSDLSHRIWSRKDRLFPENIQYVTCSEWLAEVAGSSSLLKNSGVISIPNPIDESVFKPVDVNFKRSFWLSKNLNPDTFKILFVAMKVSEERKGFQYLQESLNILKSQFPDVQADIIVMGKAEPEALATLPYPVFPLGMIKEPAELAMIYGASDVFVIPSLEDNLPNTVMESLACGTPVAGFETGGIPEMVQHLEQGFIAPQKDSRSLAEGIYWIFQHPEKETLRSKARTKVLENYAQAVVSKRYTDLYENLLSRPVRP